LICIDILNLLLVSEEIEGGGEKLQSKDLSSMKINMEKRVKSAQQRVSELFCHYYLCFIRQLLYM